MTEPLFPTFEAASLVSPPETAGSSLADVPGRSREGLRDVLADVRALARGSWASAWRGAPGEIAWGRFVDTRT